MILWYRNRKNIFIMILEIKGILYIYMILDFFFLVYKYLVMDKFMWNIVVWYIY